MASITVDQLQVLVTANTAQLQKSFNQISKQLDDVQGSTSKFSATSAALFGVVAGAAQALVSKGINMITSSVDAAAKRVDTLNNANRVFQNMGASATETKSMMTDLNKAILGLPTSLDDAVGGVEALYATSGNLKDSEQTYKALNDGILAFGGTADMVKGAVLQLSQLPMDGPLDAQTWNSLRQNGLTPVFAAMAKDSGKSVSQLKEDFGSGKLTVQDFTNELQKLDQDGGGGMASLQKQAHDATSGIQTGWANMQTAITRGVADIINAIGSKNISGAISAIGKAFETTLKDVSGLITFIANNGAVFGPLAVSILTVVAAIAAFNAALIIQNWITAFGVLKLGAAAFLQLENAGKLVAAAQWAINAAMDANPIGIIITAIAALVAGLVFFFTQTEIGRQAWGVFTNFLMVAGKGAVDFIVNAFNAITGFFTGLWNDIKNIFNGFIDFVKNNWFIILLAVFTGGLAIILGLVVRNWDSIKQFTQQLINNVIGFFQQLPSAIGNFFNSAKNAVVGIWQGIPGWFGGIISSIGSVANNVISFFRNAFNGAVNAIRSINWGSIGMDIIRGIGNGIAGMGSWLANQAKAAVGNAKDQLKSFLGIHSPSRVMRDEVGKMIGLGMAEGIDDTSKNVMSSMKDLSNLSVGNFDIGSGSLDADVSRDIIPSTGQPTQVIVKIGEDTILDKMIDGINGKSFLSGASVLNI